MKVKSVFFCVLTLLAAVSSLQAESQISPSKAHLKSPGVSSESATTTRPKAVDEVQATLNEVVDMVEKYPSERETTLRREKLHEVIAPRFDFGEMSKRSLGAQWLKCSESERKEFVEIFSDLLATTYLSRIETVKRGMVSVDGEKVDFPKAVVKTTVTHKGDTFPIDYKLVFRNGGWKVYDVVIENIGLVANYRNEFAGIVRREKFSGLMERLRKKTGTS